MVMGSLREETQVVVIGSGPGGYIAALRLADLGKDVLLIEKRNQQRIFKRSTFQLSQI